MIGQCVSSVVEKYEQKRRSLEINAGIEEILDFI